MATASVVEKQPALLKIGEDYRCLFASPFVLTSISSTAKSFNHRRSQVSQNTNSHIYASHVSALIRLRKRTSFAGDGTRFFSVQRRACTSILVFTDRIFPTLCSSNVVVEAPPTKESEIEISESPPSAEIVKKTRPPIKTERLSGLVRWKELDVSFGEKFPYWIRKETEELLTNLVFPFLRKPEFSNFCDPNTRRILLTGPVGSELYQQTIVKAVANKMRANLIVVRPDQSLIEIPDNDGSDTDHNNTGNIPMREGFQGVTVVRVPLIAGKKDGGVGNIIKDLVQYGHAAHLKRRGGAKRRVEQEDDDEDLEGLVKIQISEEDDDDFEGEAVYPSSPIRSVTVTNAPDSISKVRPGTKSSKASADGSTDSKPDEPEQPEPPSYLETCISSSIELAPIGQPYILYIPGVEEGAYNYDIVLNQLNNALSTLSGPVVVIASRTSLADMNFNSNEFPDLEDGPEPLEISMDSMTPLPPSVFFGGGSVHTRKISLGNATGVDLENIFPCEVNLPPPPPSNTEAFQKFTEQMERDKHTLNIERNIEAFCKALEKSKVEVSPSTWNEPETKEILQNTVFSSEGVSRIVGYATSRQLQIGRVPRIKDGYLRVQTDAFRYGINLYTSSDVANTQAEKALKDVDVENQYEKALLGEVIPAAEIKVRFEDIGALDAQKTALKEVVMLPLQRPELFRRGNLTKPVKGVLLFGPPGTGKTLLAKAIATEAGANFINVTASAVQSMWYGESEKYIQALFTLARKLQPCVIFCDEVDSMLGRRSSYEHEGTRRIKNEFMQFWDGLKTRSDERVLVLGATNRPFDLDEAVLRRFPRRFLVDLPNRDQRTKILSVILGSEEMGDDIDIPALAQATEGYSGSDLKNLCVSAAYFPIREVLESESAKGGLLSSDSTDLKKSKEEIVLRPLNQSDFIKAKQEVSPSVSEEEQTWQQLRKWNELYGEGGSRKKSSKSLGFSLEPSEEEHK